MNEVIKEKSLLLNSFLTLYRRYFSFCFISTIIIVLVVKSNYEEEYFYLNRLLENWRTKIVDDVKFEYNCPDNYEIVNIASWPERKTGCDCRNTILGEKDFQKTLIKPYPCQFYLKMIGCREIKNIENLQINTWKGKRFCLKRNTKSYASLFTILSNQHRMKKKKKCKYNYCSIDTTNNYVCQKKCPINNNDIKNVFRTSLKENYLMIDQNKMTNKTFGNKNSTTIRKSRRLFNKNFNINVNNFLLQNYSVSNIIVAENYPCLIQNSLLKLNEMNSLYDYLLNTVNIINTTLIQKGNLSEKLLVKASVHPDLTDERFSNFSFSDVNNEECYFYEHNYFDKRYFILDYSSFNEYLMKDTDKSDSTSYFKNMSLRTTYNSTNQSNLFLITRPFFGWNFKNCPQNPEHRIINIKSLYEHLNSHFNITLSIKIICILYLMIKGILDQDKISNLKNQFSINFLIDIIYYGLNIFIICEFLYIASKWKYISVSQYSSIIKRNCMDQNSIKTFSYLLDLAEEKLFYTIILIFVNIIEFVLFTIILYRSYEMNIKNNIKYL